VWLIQAWLIDPQEGNQVPIATMLGGSQSQPGCFANKKKMPYLYQCLNSRPSCPYPSCCINYASAGSFPYFWDYVGLWYFHVHTPLPSSYNKC